MAALDFQSKKLIPDYEINSGINFFFTPVETHFYTGVIWGKFKTTPV